MLVILALVALAPELQPADPLSKRELDKLPRVGPDYSPGMFKGRIVGFVKGGIIIRPEGSLGEVNTSTLPGGQVKPVSIYLQDNTLPPREFRFSPGLLNGGTNSTHKTTDLCIGDLVIIFCAPVNQCTRVAILRRRGGKVPPAVGDQYREARIRHDVRCNTEQFIEDKVVGVKLPWLFAHLHR